MFNPIPSYINEALARLLTQYKNSPNLQNLLTAIIGPLQEIEAALTGMNDLRYLPDAQGVQLDIIGAIVGLPRPAGMSDAQYILELYGQIKVNTSQGQPEQVIQVFQLFTGETQVRVFEEFPAEILLEAPYAVSPDQLTVNSILALIAQVTPAGVRVNGLVVYDPVKPFSYAGVLSPSGGYGTVSDGSIGGKYGSIKRFFAPFGYGVNNPQIQGYGSVNDRLVGGAYAS